MLDARTVDMVADLVGPDVKFHHCKINLKLPGAKTEVSYHQDFSYTPHTNDDIVTALLFLDDIDEGNGCLTVVPGSHKGPVLSLFEGERFTGAPEAETGAGSVDPCVGQGGRRPPDAHQAAARPGRNGSDVARPFISACLHCGRRRADRAQSYAEPQRGPHRVRRKARFARLSEGSVAQAAQDGVVLHGDRAGLEAGG